MPQLDAYLKALVGYGADALQLMDGDSATLVKDGEARPVTKQAITAPQLLALVRELAPADAQRNLDAGEPAAFRYSGPDGLFMVRAGMERGRWRAILTPDRGRPSAAIAAPAIPAEDGVGTNGASDAAAAPSVASGETPVVSAASQRGVAAMEKLLRVLVDRGGSDLHLRVDEPPILRLNGEILRLDGAALSNDEVQDMLLSIMPERNKKEYRESNDTDFAYEIEGLARFRANALRDRKGSAAVFRVIPATVVSVEQMGITTEVQNLCYLTKGLVLVTGPTGSGKSTTLCALIDLVNRSRNDHVITIEDPIEFVHPNKKCVITQRQVGVHTTSFKSALRAALREDPNIVLVGELRDLETVAIAIETAETGHLVFGTLHTTTAAGTVDRIIDQFPADRQEQIRVMLAESLKGVVSQTLCRKIGGGRVAAREILLTIPAVSNLIREGKTFQIPSVMQTSRKIGMTTLNDALIDLVDGRQVEPKEAYTKAVEKTGFLAMLKARGHDTAFIEGEGGMGASQSAAAGIKPGAGSAAPARPQPPARR